MDNPWKTATFVLGGLLVVQFWWWNKQAPEVLNLSGVPPRRRLR
jgi:hypothetical protein